MYADRRQWLVRAFEAQAEADAFAERLTTASFAAREESAMLRPRDSPRPALDAFRELDPDAPPWGADAYDVVSAPLGLDLGMSDAGS